MLVEDFNRTIDIWIKDLEPYDFTRLCARPSPGSWSIGQVYMHLIAATGYFFDQVKICVTTNDHANEEASPAAEIMFLNNDFPDEVMEGPPENAYTLQPESKQQLLTGLIMLKKEVNNLGILMAASRYKGKTKHPGLNYFTADEWFRFAEMHFRHHLRQKKRITELLSKLS